MLEIVVSQALWICHSLFFGIVSSNNDINMSYQFNVFIEILEGQAPKVQYTINRTLYKMGHYVVDNIYLEWTTFVKTIQMSQEKTIFSMTRNN